MRRDSATHANVNLTSSIPDVFIASACLTSLPANIHRYIYSRATITSNATPNRPYEGAPSQTLTGPWTIDSFLKGRREGEEPTEESRVSCTTHVALSGHGPGVERTWPKYGETMVWNH
jgi:hypothetical protein